MKIDGDEFTKKEVFIGLISIIGFLALCILADNI